MEKGILWAIYVHALFGGIGLLSGAVSIVVKKGSLPHRKSGTVFSVSMIIASLISLVIARMPNHENLFLFLIGIFTIYMVLAGNRFLTFKNPQKTAADNIDKLVSGSMLVCSVVMCGIGAYILVKGGNNGVLFLFFGIVGSFLSLRDFTAFKTFKEKKNVWLVQHIGRMVGAFLASITAFIVAGLHIGTLAAWISPTIIGTAYIIYWVKKVSPNKKPTPKTII